jgi:Fe-S oxidoreductase
VTTTYDPKHPTYLDESDLREELTRVYDLCHGCRLCWNLCPSFPTLFDYIDERDGDVGALTEAEQDQVVDECYQCKLCYVKCPYIPPHEWALDFPRLMLRAEAVEHSKRKLDPANEFFGRTDMLGTLGSTLSPLVNLGTGKPGSLGRRLMEKVTGVASQRILPPYAKQRFSTWFKKRTRPRVEGKNGSVAMFQTCLVEYQNPGIGMDAVKVYERNDIACDVPDGTVCCGMPWLDGGDIAKFEEQGRKNVKVLADQVRKGRDIVVPQPTCGYVLKREYPEYFGGEDAELVAAHTYDVCEYLMKVHRQGAGLDTEFTAPVETITWHVPCHLRAQSIGYKSRDLMELTGATVTTVDKCSGIDGTWGLRAENYQLAKKVIEPLKQAVEASGSDVVAGDCNLANGAILEETGRQPVHPIQVVARAYGITPEDK